MLRRARKPRLRGQPRPVLPARRPGRVRSARRSHAARRRGDGCRTARATRADRRCRAADVRRAARRATPARGSRFGSPTPSLPLPGYRAAHAGGVVSPDSRRALPRRSDRRAVRAGRSTSPTRGFETSAACTGTAAVSSTSRRGWARRSSPFRFFARPEATELVVRSPER